MHERHLTLIEAIVVIVILAGIVVIIINARGRSLRSGAIGVVCEQNLRDIFVSMYQYSYDYDGRLPCVSPPAGSIVGSPYEQGIDILDGKENAGALVSQGINDRTVSMNLWLLVREGFTTSEVFLCPISNKANLKLNMKDKDGAHAGPLFFTDFPFADGSSISYSFIQPWTVWSGTETKGNNRGNYEIWMAYGEPEVVIGGDQNDGKYLTMMNPTPEDIKRVVNSQNHNGDGQNLLFSDGHVSFYPTPYVGVEKDNIYTAMPGDYTGDPGRTSGILSVKPRNQFDPKINKPRQWDTVLIPVDSANLKAWNPKP